MEKWPLGEWSDPRFTIKIQQDNAGGHASANDRFITSAIRSMEQQQVFMPGKISFYAQPANSLDLNILDLGFFNALQSTYLNMVNMAPETSIDVMDCVIKPTMGTQPTNSTDFGLHSSC
jgi:hypothetical protein